MSVGLALGVLAAAPMGSASSPMFVPASGSPFAVAAGPVAIAAGDFNGDGQPDLVTNAGTCNVSMLLDNGSGSFTASPGSPFSATPPLYPGGVECHARNLAVTDFDGDGHVDVVAANPSSVQGVAGGGSLLLGDGSGALASAACAPELISFQPVAVAAADFNEDGKPDLAFTDTSDPAVTGGVHIFLGNGAAGDVRNSDGSCNRFATEASGSPYVLPWVATGSLNSRPSAIAVADFNGDGHLDLAVTNYDAHNITVLLGNGAGAFTEAAASPLAMPLNVAPGAVAVGDFNSDGKLDLAVAHDAYVTCCPSQALSVTVFLGNGAGGFTATASSPFSDGGINAVDVAVADFNSDGRDDLAVTNGSNDVSVMLGNGAGGFAAAPGSPFATSGTQAHDVVAADFNGDGRPDIAFSNAGSNNVTVLLNAGVSDSNPPSVACTPPSQTLWYGGDVSVPCTASDNGSGLANAADGSFSLSTSVALETETGSASTNSRRVCDNAGNCATAGPYTFMVDRKAPTITCTAASFLLNQSPATVTGVATDGGSGPATQTVSATADTSSAGTKSLNLTASDNVGNTSAKSCPYSVDYVFSGFLAPVNNPNTVNTGKAGRTYPVKWQLSDATGGFVTTLGAISDITWKATACSGFTSDPSDALETSTTGASGLRYDSTSNDYVYNWASPTTRGCYTLFLKLNSGQTFPAFFSLS